MIDSQFHQWFDDRFAFFMNRSTTTIQAPRLTSLHPWSCLSSMQGPTFAFHLHFCDVSPPFRSTNLHLTSIRAPSQMHASFKMCASPQPRSPKLHLSCILASYTTFKVSRCSSHLHSDHISAQFKSYDSLLNSIKVMSQLIPGLVDRISAHSRPKLNAFQVSGFVSHLHPGPVPPAFKSQDSCVTSNRAPSKFHLGKNIHISPPPMSRPSRSRYSHLTTIQVTPHLDPVHDNRILDVVPLQLIQVSSWLSRLNPCPISPSAKSQDLHLNSSQTPRYISHLHLDSISTKFRSLHLCFTSILVMTYLQPGPQNCISALLKPHPQKLHLRSSQPTHQTHISFKMCVSTPRRSYLTWIKISVYCVIIWPSSRCNVEVQNHL